MARLSVLTALALSFGFASLALGDATRVFVDPARGHDQADGRSETPLRTIHAALARLPDRIDDDVEIRLAEGTYDTTGGTGCDAQRLELSRPMREGVQVRIIGTGASHVVLDWNPRPDGFLVVVTQGRWSLENVQVATRKPSQRQGISVSGAALLELHNVRIHTGSQSAPGLHAHHGGTVHLYGQIELNEDLHDDRGKGESFCGMKAEYFGTIRFRQREGASLSMGNGNLDVSSYGIVELGCEQARITSWADQSNPLAINDSGRIGLRSTPTTLCARNPRNTPIGLEHDGHLLAEGARIVIIGCGNEDAIVLQKASSFFCNDVEIRGPVKQALLAYSGSTLLAGIIGDLGAVRATTGATIIVEKCTGKLVGPVKADAMGQVSLPDGKTMESPQPLAQTQPAGSASSSPAGPSDEFAPATLPPLHRAAYDGQIQKVTELIQAGADVRAKGPRGLTPLHLAAMGGHQQTAQVCLDAGADLNARDDQGRTPLALAEAHSHAQLAAYLRQRLAAK